MIDKKEGLARGNLAECMFTSSNGRLKSTPLSACTLLLSSKIATGVYIFHGKTNSSPRL